MSWISKEKYMSQMADDGRWKDGNHLYWEQTMLAEKIKLDNMLGQTRANDFIDACPDPGTWTNHTWVMILWEAQSRVVRCWTQRDQIDLVELANAICSSVAHSDPPQ